MIFSAKPNKLTNTSLPSSTAGALLGVLSMVWCTFTRTYTNLQGNFDTITLEIHFCLSGPFLPKKCADEVNLRPSEAKNAAQRGRFQGDFSLIFCFSGQKTRDYGGEIA